MAKALVPIILIFYFFLAIIFVTVAAIAQPLAPAALHRPDRVCSSCHQAIYSEYEKTNMANGSGLAVDGFIAGGLKHRPSGITYDVYLKDGQAWMSYDRPGPSDALHGSQKLDYYIGSSHRGRTYLFQQDGLWFENPINYYGKKQLWDMAPGYSKTQTLPLTLPVDSNCLHCHASEVSTSVPDVRNKYAGAPFAAAGVGCAACHGDPTSHVASELAGKGLGMIVNPAKLKSAERDSTCLQCHLEGDAAIYKPGRSLAAYKAGENLSDSVVYFVNTSRPNFGDRASSQYEALLRSACKRAAGEKLTCTTCHDPHSSPSPEQRVEFYRSKCLTCHTGISIATQHHPEQRDCAVCHMPTRDTKDISHEQLTDHDIERTPHASTSSLQLMNLGELPVEKPADLIVVGNGNYTDRELGLAYVQLARKGDRTSAEKAMHLLSTTELSGNADADVHLQLGFLKQISGHKQAAQHEYQSALQLDASNVVAMSNLAVLDAASARSDEAIHLLQKVIQEDPSQTIAGMNLAFIQCGSGRPAEALTTLEKISLFNPDNGTLRTFLGTGVYAGRKCDLHLRVD